MTGTRQAHRLAAVAVAVALLLLGLAPAAGASGSAESSFVAKLNAERTQRGLPALGVDGQLTHVARDWTAQMAAQGAISHRPNLRAVVAADAARVGENVGRSVLTGAAEDQLIERIHRAFMESPGHRQNVLVSTGGFIEYVLTQGREAVDRYIEECKRLGFDVIELSAGFITLPTDDWLRLVEKVQKAGLKAKPEVGIQFGAGGATAAEELETEGTRDPRWVVSQARRFLDAGAYMIMIESEGITESVKSWRTDVPARIVEALGLEKVMFEAADPEVFAWYVKNYGPEVNLFVDHSQIVQLECLRQGIWGTKSLWGRVLAYKG